MDLSGAIGNGDGGIEHGASLVRFAEAATRGSEDLGAARAALIDAVGRDAFVDAAGIVGIFNGLVRTADSSGIPLDDGTRDTSGEFRANLGLDAFAGAANTTNAEPSAEAPTSVESAFR